MYAGLRRLISTRLYVDWNTFLPVCGIFFNIFHVILQFHYRISSFNFYYCSLARWQRRAFNLHGENKKFKTQHTNRIGNFPRWHRRLAESARVYLRAIWESANANVVVVDVDDVDDVVWRKNGNESMKKKRFVFCCFPARFKNLLLKVRATDGQWKAIFKCENKTWEFIKD